MGWDRIRSSYDVVAAKYEDRFRDELDGKPRDRELLEAFAQSVGDPVIDIGCGPGQVGAVVREHGRRVVGLDLSHEMTKLARSRLGAAVTGDMRALPVAPSSVGGLLAFYSLIHLRRSELNAALREYHRVLRPGGRILFSAHEGEGELEVDEFLDEPVPFAASLFALDELARVTRSAGFEVIRTERREPYPSEHQTFRLYVEARR